VSAVCAGCGRNGLQQDDGLLVGEAQESGCNDFYCGWMVGRSRLFDEPIALVEQAWWLPTALDIVGAPYLLVASWIGIEKWLNSREKVH
jgi:hypothetical protein